MAHSPHPELYSYQDYASWDDGQRWEIFDGHPVMLSPAPNIWHQRAVGELYRQLANQLEDKPCEPFVAPVDVLLAENAASDAAIHTIVQPDVMIVCDPTKITQRGIEGPPDFIIELASPSTGYRDATIKKTLYAQFGVREYWIIEHDPRRLTKHLLGENRQWDTIESLPADGTHALQSISGLTVELAPLFRHEPPPKPVTSPKPPPRLED